MNEIIWHETYSNISFFFPRHTQMDVNSFPEKFKKYPRLSGLWGSKILGHALRWGSRISWHIVPTKSQNFIKRLLQLQRYNESTNPDVRWNQSPREIYRLLLLRPPSIKFSSICTSTYPWYRSTYAYHIKVNWTLDYTASSSLPYSDRFLRGMLTLENQKLCKGHMWVSWRLPGAFLFVKGVIGGPSIACRMVDRGCCSSAQ